MTLSKEKVSISVIIPTYNRKKILVNTVESILDGKKIPVEILIIDQSTTPLDINEYREWEGIVKIVHEKIQSSTHARNIGIELACCDTILFCDDDIEVNDETIEGLDDDMSDGNIALVAAINSMENAIYQKKHAKRHRSKDIFGTICGTKCFWKNGGYIVKYSVRGRYADGIDKRQKTEWAYGFFFCVRKSLISKWNINFDENLIKYAYAEDLDFSYRYCQNAILDEKKTIVDPKLYVHHIISNEWRTPSTEAIEFGYTNKWYLSYKLFPGKWWYRIGLVWSDLCYVVFIYHGLEKKIAFQAMRRAWKARKILKSGHIPDK